MAADLQPNLIKRNINIIQIKNDLEDYREILLPLSKVLEWEKSHHPFILSTIITFVFALIWYAQPSVLTTISLIGLIITSADFIAPFVLSKLFNKELWSKEKEDKYEQICTRIANVKLHIKAIFNFLKRLKEHNPKSYVCLMLTICCTTAWIGNLIDNLFLTYLILLVTILLPGLRKHGIIQKFTSTFLSGVRSILNKTKVPKKDN